MNEIIPKIFKEYAKAYIKVAEKDLERAYRALESQDYAQCVFYAQQCIEKSVKAMLELKLFYTRSHDILSYFIEKFKDEWKDEFNIIIEALEETRWEWSRTRYPFEERNQVMTPEEYYDRKRAEITLNYAKKVLEIARKIFTK